MIDAPRQLNVDDLHKIVSTLPDDMKNHDGGRMIGLANTVIVHFLGREWFEEHIRPDAPKRGFLRMDFSSAHRREATVFRVVELAESQNTGSSLSLSDRPIHVPNKSTCSNPGLPFDAFRLAAEI